MRQMLRGIAEVFYVVLIAVALLVVVGMVLTMNWQAWTMITAVGWTRPEVMFLLLGTVCVDIGAIAAAKFVHDHPGRYQW